MTARRNVSDLYPLSPMQHGMLFHSLYQPGSSVYVEQVTCTLTGRLEEGSFGRAWEAVVERHAVLKSSFFWQGLDQPVQSVWRAVELPLAVQDWRDLSPAESEARLEAFLAEDRERGFDLKQAPLLRLALIRTGEEEHRFVWTFHHLLLDGWSVALVLDEVLRLYGGSVRGEGEVELGPVRPYRDYIRWLQEKSVAEAEAYWRSSLAGFTTPTRLMVDRRAQGPPARLGELETGLSAAETGELRRWAGRHGLTLSTVIHGAWALLLSAYSGEREVLFGTIVSGRPPELEGVESMVGLFINALPLRLRVPPDSGVLPWLRRLQAEHAELREHEHSSLVEIHGWSELAAGESLFDSIVVFENYPSDPAAGEASGLRLGATRVSEHTNYPLNLAVGGGEELTFRTLYDPARFEAETVERVVSRLKTLLGRMTAAPDEALGELDLLEAGERRQVLSEWTDTARPYPRDATLGELVAARAAERPEAVAAVFGEASLSYGELERRAGRLARVLRAAGLGPDGIVGLCVEPSVEMVVGMVGIVRAGGAYLPLDPAYPPERLRLMLADAGAWVVVTHGPAAAAVSDLDAAVVPVDAGELPAPAGSGEELAEETAGGARAESLAYVLYTSGSTGSPKGVAVPHRAVVRLLLGTDYVGLGPDDRLAQAANGTFDAATFEIWGALLGGGCAVGFPRDVVLSPEALCARLAAERISHLFLTTALFNQVSRAVPGAFSTVDSVLFGGEAVDPERVRGVLEDGPPERLLHVYGPTESTTFATWERVTAVATDATTVPIGRPVANTTAYLVNDGLAPVPIGALGELLLGGDGLARGYLARPGLTAERFVPSPFGPRGARLYRTGDGVRWRPEGSLEFVGRRDGQVKIRGFRIELGEVEAVLGSHPGVVECVVTAPEDGPGGRRLVAYVVAAEGEGADPASWRAHLEDRLPGYMVPGAFVRLEALPLNANGKVDRRALPAPEEVAPEAAPEDRPRTAIEEVLSGIWGDVLGVSRVRLHDDFFDLGGHSLLATRVISRVRRAFAIDLPLRDLFEAPTVRGLAGRVDAALRAGAGDDAPPLVPVERRDVLPLSFAQQRLWFLDQMEPESAYYNLVTALRLEGSLVVEALTASLDEIVARHEALRTCFPAVDGKPRQVVREHRPLTVVCDDLSHRPPEEREAAMRRLAVENATRPFDLQEGPLVRARLVRLGPREQVLVLTLHHIVADGWSLEILWRELMVLYQASAAGRPAPLEPLSIQYADFAAWQRDWLQGEVRDRQLAYWRERLDDPPSPLELPIDRPRPAVRSTRGAVLSFAWPEELLDDLRGLGRRQDATLFMILLGALQALLHRYTGEDDVCVGAAIANRNRGEAEGLIGFFVNTLVMRTSLGGAPTVRELLRRVREVSLGAFAHQEFPFEQLLEALQPERSTSHTPFFQAMLGVQSRSRGTLELPGLEVSSVEIDTGTAKLDLTVSITETPTELLGVVEYSSDLFDATTIRRLVGHLRSLLAGAAREPERRVASLDLLSSAERHHVLRSWNDTGGTVAAEDTIHSRFEAQVARRPRATAVVFGDEALEYGELNRRANRLAHHLRWRGVGSDSLVGLFVGRSVDMVVGMLGVLKAGGAYLPLDPDYPQERLAFMLGDAGVEALLTQGELQGRLPPFAGELLCLDRDRDLWSDEPVTDPRSGSRADSLAYVMYTSGSTGLPKGVAVPHRGVIRLVVDADFDQVGPEDRVAQAATSSFDAATLEIWAPLLNGGRLVGIPREVLLAPQALGDRLRAEGVTWMFLTTTLFNQVVAEAPDALAGPRIIFFGGEAADPQSARSALDHCGPGRLVHAYGPTENTTFSTCFRVSDVEAGAGTVPIGRPIARSTAFVLDRWMEAAPIGVTGELCVGGAGLARGYVRRPKLTAERFVPAPFGTPGERLYRTGDLVRTRSDGTVVFLGRRDHQVKIRGFRIELGEIEAVLGQHPAVRECVVVLGEGSGASMAGGPKQLVAYLRSDWEPAPSAEELRSFVAEQLPGYMVPHVFVPLTTMPVGPNGKVDRRALPMVAEVSVEAEERFVEPETAAERAAARIWADILGVEKVGVHDDFFHLGGHSLLATQVISRVRQELEVDLPLRSLFEAPTLGAFAERIAEVLPLHEEESDLAALLEEIEDLSLDEVGEALAEIEGTLSDDRGRRAAKTGR